MWCLKKLKVRPIISMPLKTFSKAKWGYGRQKSKKNKFAKKFHILFFPLMAGLINNPSYITEPLIKDVTEANTDGGSAK